jgi:hypothetical protein
VKPRWIVCEDGDEYLSRLGRFLAAEFEFVAASHLQDVLRSAPGASGLVLDLDFRRCEAAHLVDECGTARPDVPAGERKRLAEVQGILILRALRKHGVSLPALLCADLDDPDRAKRLEDELRPVEIVPGSEGVMQIGARLRRHG